MQPAARGPIFFAFAPHRAAIFAKKSKTSIRHGLVSWAIVIWGTHSWNTLRRSHS